MSKIIAVDFDGTLCRECYPEIGEPNYPLLTLVKEAKKAGAKLILWTCRQDTPERAYVQEAVEWCRKFGLEFDAVNENLTEVKAKWGGDTRKVYCDYYLDDKGVGYHHLLAFDQIVGYLHAYENN